GWGDGPVAGGGRAAGAGRAGSAASGRCRGCRRRHGPGGGGLGGFGVRCRLVLRGVAGFGHTGILTTAGERDRTDQSGDRDDRNDDHYCDDRSGRRPRWGVRRATVRWRWLPESWWWLCRRMATMRWADRALRVSRVVGSTRVPLGSVREWLCDRWW